VEWWTAVRLAAQGLLDQHGVLAAFLFILIEEAGVPVPVPGDFIMLVVGVHARQGQTPLWQGIVAMEAATLIGSTFLYLLARRAGRGLVYKYGRFIHLSPARLDQTERWLTEKGSVAIVLGRLIPGLRIATPITCGVFAVPLWRFIPALGVGALGYILLYTLLGYFLGPTVLALLEGIHLPLGLLGSLVPLVLLLVWVVRTRRAVRPDPRQPTGVLERRHRLRDGAVAGGLATVVSTLALNVIVHVAGDLALLAPGVLVEQTAARLGAVVVARSAGPLLFILAVPVFIAVGILWGMAYAEWVEPRLHWPDWLEGVVFSLVPLAAALLVVLPVLQSTLPAIGAIGAVGAAGELVRHLIYGLVLGLTYPLRLLRRPTGQAAAPPTATLLPGPLAESPGATS